MRIVLLGHQKWASMTLEALVKTEHEIVGVITETDEFEEENRSYYDERKKWGIYQDLKQTAQDLRLPVFQPENINDGEVMAQLNPDLAISVSYHNIIKNKLLGKYTFINAHGAMLPQYRGRAPINWAIINGEKEAGVTVHYMARRVDEGRILAQRGVPIGPNDNMMDVLKNSLPYYPELVLEAVERVRAGFKGREQDNSKSTYHKDLESRDVAINWYRPGQEIHNLVRGAFPTMMSTSVYQLKGEDHRVQIYESRFIHEKDVRAMPGVVYRKGSDGSMIVKTGEGSLEIKTSEKIPLGVRLWTQ